jgi:pentatricopeptide repeat protein
MSETLEALPQTTATILDKLNGRPVVTCKRILVSCLVQVGAYDEAIDALYRMKEAEKDPKS